MSEIELYDPDIQYKPGKENVIPDLLSRRDGPECKPVEESVKPKYLYSALRIKENTLKKPVKSIKDDPTQD